jgi:phosphohistidine phosphatase
VDVLVVRHAIALDKAEAERLGMPDSERPLTREGRARMKRVARGLGKRVPDLSVLFTSPWRRAVETAELLRKRYAELGWVETQALIPGAEPAALAGAVSERAYEGVVGVVGHEPHLSAWVTWCLTGESRASVEVSPELERPPVVELRKGGACLLRFPREVAPGRGRLLWLVTSGIARRL